MLRTIVDAFLQFMEASKTWIAATVPEPLSSSADELLKAGKWIFTSGLFWTVVSIVLIAPLTAALLERHRRGRSLDARKAAAVVLYRDAVKVADGIAQGYRQLQCAIDEDPAGLKTAAHVAHGRTVEYKTATLTGIETHRTDILKAQTRFREKVSLARQEFSDGEQACRQILQESALFAQVLDPGEMHVLVMVGSDLAEIEACFRSLVHAIDCALRSESLGTVRAFEYDAAFERMKRFIESIDAQETPDHWVVRAVDSFISRNNWLVKALDWVLRRKVYEPNQPTFSEAEKNALKEGLELPLRDKLLPRVDEQKKLVGAFRALKYSTFDAWIRDCDEWIAAIKAQHPSP